MVSSIFYGVVNLPPSFFDCDLKGHRAPYIRKGGQSNGRIGNG